MVDYIPGSLKNKELKDPCKFHLSSDKFICSNSFYAICSHSKLYKANEKIPCSPLKVHKEENYY